MSNDYEKTFSVRVPPERAFRAFTDPNELEQWFTPKFDADAEEGAPGVKADAASPGGEVHFEVTQIKGDELLCYRQWAADPNTGIDVTVVFEPVEGGTRITVTHAGFGGDSILKSDSVRNGMFENYADLMLYLDHGVSFPRHRDITTDAWLGALFLDAGPGAEVANVESGGFADQVGLQPGDILLQLGAGPVFGNREVMFFLREHDVGDVVSAVWAHDGTIQRGTGALTKRDLLAFAHNA
ncbi:MAG TPA: SRPBCC domain-containing protein [Acidimicrobiia bacterium]|nr:SRPBCC domain-containing protein [Acidimicrobiia bacterium]